MTISSIEKPIEQKHTGKGNPNAITIYDRPLNNRQQHILDLIPDYDDRVVVNKKSVSMSDLSALTAKTGDEFAMFTKGRDRLIVRGNNQRVNIDPYEAAELAEQGYKWSGHTHPGSGDNAKIASDGYKMVLKEFRQSGSVIYDSKGAHERYGKA